MTAGPFCFSKRVCVSVAPTLKILSILFIHASKYTSPPLFILSLSRDALSLRARTRCGGRRAGNRLGNDGHSELRGAQRRVSEAHHDLELQLVAGDVGQSGTGHDIAAGVGGGEVLDVDLVTDHGLLLGQKGIHRAVRGLFDEHHHGRGAELGGVRSEVLRPNGDARFAGQPGPNGRVEWRASRRRLG